MTSYAKTSPFPARRRVSHAAGSGNERLHGTGYKNWADKEVFGLLRKKSSKVPNSGQAFLDITPPQPVRMEELRKNTGNGRVSGRPRLSWKNARVMGLGGALNFAVHRNRNYLLQKEVVYLAALDLTLTRQQYTPDHVGRWLEHACEHEGSERREQSGAHLRADLQRKPGLFGT
jgi:hypothetical protein